MRTILFLARADFVYMMRQRETLLWTFIMPVLFMYFIGLTTGGFGGPPTSDKPVGLALVVEAKAGGILLDELVQRLEEQNFKVVRDLDPKTLASYRRRLTVPASRGDHASFTAAVLAGEETVLRFRRSGESRSRNLDRMKINKAIYTLLAELAVLRVDKKKVDDAAFAALQAAPRNLKLTVKPAGRRNAIPTGYAQAIPGTMIMFTMMILLTGGAITLVVERQQGLLRRLASAPITRGQLVLGKWLGKLLLGVIQIAFALLVSVTLFDMDWGPRKLMVGVVLLAWAAFNTSLGIFLGNLARTEDQMSGIGVLASLTLAALGGCWWPIEVTPDWMQSFALCLPTGWAMDAIHRLVSFQQDSSAAIPHVLGMVAAAVIVGLLARRNFRYQ